MEQKSHKELKLLENIYETYFKTNKEVNEELINYLKNVKEEATQKEREFIISCIMDLMNDPQYYNLVNVTTNIFFNDTELHVNKKIQNDDIQNINELEVIEEIYKQYADSNYKISNNLKKYLTEVNESLTQEQKETIIKYIMDSMLPDSKYSDLINELPSILYDSDEQEVYYSESDDIDESLYSSLSGSSDDFDEYSSDKSRSSSLSYSE